MAHNIEIVNGQASIMLANKGAWHHLGEIKQGNFTADDIRNADWYFTVGTKEMMNPFTGEPTGIYLVYREDNKHIFQTVTKRYEPFQIDSHLNIVEAIVNADDKAYFETAGVLGKGERVFFTVNLNCEKDILGSGDKHISYLVATGSFDSSLSNEYFISETRVVCQNTLSIAMKDGKSKVKAKSTRNAEATLDQRIRNLNDARMMFNSTMEKMEFLATKKINSAIVDDVLKTVFKFDDEKGEYSRRAKGSVEIVKQLLESNDKDAFPQFRGTAYNLLNAFTEYGDHYSEVRITEGRQGMSADYLRAESAVFGSMAQTKAQVLDVILEASQTLASTNSSRSYSFSNSDAEVLDAILSK